MRFANAGQRIGLIDLFVPLSNHPEFFPDKIHPNAAGAKVIADQVFEAIQPVKLR
jgi:acyl-CoA thioesterase-1